MRSINREARSRFRKNANGILIAALSLGLEAGGFVIIWGWSGRTDDSREIDKGIGCVWFFYIFC